MLRFGRNCTILFCLCIFIFPISSFAEDEIEDLIDLLGTKDKIIAVIEGRKSISFDLRVNEKVIWEGSRGYLGAFLTNRHFFVISATSNTWRALPLNLSESDKGVTSLSPYIALFVTKERAIGFDAATNRFVEIKLSNRDELIAAEAGKYVAVVITSSRAYGLALEASSFSEVQLRNRETIESVKVTESKATVVTSDRILTFEAEGFIWNEHRL
jgi:hypothetical protein